MKQPGNAQEWKNFAIAKILEIDAKLRARDESLRVAEEAARTAQHCVHLAKTAQVKLQVERARYAELERQMDEVLRVEKDQEILASGVVVPQG